MRPGFTDLTLTRVGVARIEHSGAMAALRFKLIQTRRRRFLSRCSRCRRLHARGRRERVHRDDDLFEVLDEVHGCPYVVQYVVQYVTYHARRAADVQKCKASRRGAIVLGFSGHRGRV